MKHKKSDQRLRSDGRIMTSTPNNIDRVLRKNIRVKKLGLLKNALQETEDNRQWHPDVPYGVNTVRWRTPLRRDTGKSRIIPRASYIQSDKRKNIVNIPYQLGFSIPKNVIVCIRRKIRKQVMFALKLTKRGSGSGRRRRYTEDSKYRC